MNGGVACLNRFAGYGHANQGSSCRCSKVQRTALHSLAQIYSSLGPPPVPPPVDIFPALPYLSEGAGPVPCQSGNASLPESGSPFRLEEGVSPDVFEQIVARLINCCVLNHRQRQLSPPLALCNHTSTPPLFQLNFSDLFGISCMIKPWWSGRSGDHPFWVSSLVFREIGKLRLILDTRIVNCYLKEPPKT